SNFALTEDGKGYDVTSKSVTRMQRYKADVSPRFLLTREQPRPGENLREAYARLLTDHIQFAKATVNLIWAELLGVGIVDPPFSSRFDAERQRDYARDFARHFRRRLPAAQIWDAIAQSTGLFLEIPILRSDRKVRYVLQTIDPDDLTQKEVKPLADLLASFGL